MKLKNIVFEDFINYKKPSMFLVFPKCNFKCNKECGRDVCQNMALAREEDKEVDINSLLDRYLNNPITKAIVCGGMEPFDSWDDLRALISSFRYYTPDDIVIYTGYNEDELTEEQKHFIKLYADDGDIIVKYGRYIPDQEPHFDEELGVMLASPNQKAVRYSDYQG